MNELFREIEDGIKQENLERFWRSFGRVMVWASAAVVFGTVCFVLWQNKSQNMAEAKTSELLRGMERLYIEDYSGAIPIFEGFIKDPKSSYYGIAMLQKAKAEELSGNKEAAKKTYEAASAGDTVFASVAKMRSGKMDGIENSPISPTVMEYKGWMLLGDGSDAEKKSQAADIFAKLAYSNDVPEHLSERAKEVLRTIAPNKESYSDKKVTESKAN